MFPLLPLLSKLRRPNKTEITLVGVVLVVLLLISWVNRGAEIKRLQTALDAKPLVESVRHTEKQKNVKRGPSKTTTKITFDPNTGKKLAVEKVKESGPVEEHTAAELDETRKATPICSPIIEKTWALGGTFDLRQRNRGSIGVSKSLGILSVGVGHDVGQGAQLGDMKAGISLKLF